jgi:TRAP-type C4-dicarboxylate transport system substrate-binding protein
MQIAVACKTGKTRRMASPSDRDGEDRGGSLQMVNAVEPGQRSDMSALTMFSATRRIVMSKQLKMVVAGMLAAGLAATAAAKEYRSADVHPEDYPTVMAVKFMSDQIKQKTGGKDSIKVYTGNQLGGEKDTIEQVKIGALDLVRINVAPMNNICPETMVPTMPFLFKSKDHMRKTLDGPIGDEILKACEKQGYIGLAFYDSGSRSLYTTK